jgi:hypothetical protein
LEAASFIFWPSSDAEKPWRLSRVILSSPSLQYVTNLSWNHAPPNVLIFDGIPKVSDLGIAHVVPETADDSLLTLPAERLMNKDYYASEVNRHTWITSLFAD